MSSAQQRVLVVEDDESIRESIQLVLENEGYETATARNGAEALELLTREAGWKPGLILLDLMMPVMNGWEFMTARAREPRLSSIPVVVLSATLRAGGSPEGANSAIPKPFSVGELLSEVRAHVLPG